MVASAQGQDRSSYQPVVPWTGLSFGIAKATEGTAITDPSFARNWRALSGSMRGAYHFLHPDENGVTQAQHFMSAVKPQGLVAGDMLWCDSELPAGNADAVTLAFLREAASLAPTGVIVGTYTNHNVGQSLKQTAATFPDLWFAWPSRTAPPQGLYAPFKGWRIWQYGIGALSGGTVDLDAYNGTAAQMHAWLHPAITKVNKWIAMPGTTLALAARRHSTTPAIMLSLATAAGHVYRPAMRAYIAAGDWNAKLPPGVLLYAPA
jgi:lysozyme